VARNYIYFPVASAIIANTRGRFGIVAHRRTPNRFRVNCGIAVELAAFARGSAPAGWRSDHRILHLAAKISSASSAKNGNDDKP